MKDEDAAEVQGLSGRTKKTKKKKKKKNVMRCIHMLSS